MKLHTTIATLAWILLPLLHCQPAPQQPLPQMCGQEAASLRPGPSDPPIVTFWNQSAPARNWKPPACTGWNTEGFSTLVATAGRFRGPSGVDDMLRRIGAVSQLTGVRYWSTTHQQWQTLIVEAHALSAPQGNLRRNDFSPDEMKAGGVLYYQQLDNLSGKAIYRMHIAEASENRIVFDVENVSTIRYALLTLFHPAELQTIYFLDREGENTWRYYNLLRTGQNASSLTTGKPASSINRAVAFFRHFAGIPTDAEPPAAK